MVVNGNVNVFNFKVLAFLICRGTDATKIDCLWDLIWGMKNAKAKKKTIKWDSKNLKQFFKKLFYFTEIFPKKFYTHYEKDMDSFQWRAKKGIKSLKKDILVWTEEKIDTADKEFNNKMENYYSHTLLDKIFGNASILTYNDFVIKM
jgi:hypothetical protein